MKASFLGHVEWFMAFHSWSIHDDDYYCFCIFGNEVLIDTYSSDQNGDSTFCGASFSEYQNNKQRKRARFDLNIRDLLKEYS